MVIPTIADIQPNEWYCQSKFCNIVMSDGRRLDEALKNHPYAPIPMQGQRVGKYFKGHEVVAFFAKCEKQAKSLNQEFSVSSRAANLSEHVAEHLRVSTPDTKYIRAKLNEVWALIDQIDGYSG